MDPIYDMITAAFDGSAGRTPEQARLHRLLQKHSGPNLMEILTGDGSPEAVEHAARQLEVYFESAKKGDDGKDFRLTEWNEFSRASRLELLEYIWCHFEPSRSTFSSVALSSFYSDTNGPISCFQLVPAMVLSGYMPKFDPRKDDYFFQVRADAPPDFKAETAAPPSVHRYPRAFSLSAAFRRSDEGRQLLKRWDSLAGFNFPG